jgi:hypothetical protein
MNTVILLLLFAGGLMFAAASLLSMRNYWTTRGLTNYWLLIGVTALLGAAWTGSVILGDLFGITVGWLQHARVMLAVAALGGYTVSLVQASAADVVTEIV